LNRFVQALKADADGGVKAVGQAMEITMGVLTTVAGGGATSGSGPTSGGGGILPTFTPSPTSASALRIASTHYVTSVSPGIDYGRAELARACDTKVRCRETVSIVSVQVPLVVEYRCGWRRLTKTLWWEMNPAKKPGLDVDLSCDSADIARERAAALDRINGL